MGNRNPLAAPFAFLVLATLPVVPAAAQVSREVVQELPPPEQDDLNDALRRLGRNANDTDAQIDAGLAWLALGDANSAGGYLRQARLVRPNDSRVLAGLAAIATRSSKPVEALSLFEQAERYGSVPASLFADRGLAYDLVGDNARAQAAYRLALSQGEDSQITRQLAISQAIGGDLTASEATLLPLLQAGDRPAFRSRAFVLAIHGDLDEAMSIADVILSPATARQLRPYLDAMPRLTRAQQAAAANLGVFPERGELGQDAPAIAAIANDATPATIARLANEDGSGDRLVPQGEPFGTQARAEPVVQSVAPAPRPAPEPSPPPATASAELPPVGSTPTAAQPVAQSVAEPTPRPALAIALPEPEPEPEPEAQPGVETSPARVPGTFDLARIDPSETSATSAPASTVEPAAVPPSSASEPAEPVSLSDAFSEFTLASGPATPATGAVDITAIEIRREVRPQPEPEPEPAKPATPPPPAIPSRVWVQVATGQDISALVFDWRRISRKAPELLGEREGYTASWGQTNRLVTGPLPSVKAANDLVSALKEAGVDSFRFTSAAGEAVTALP